MPMVHRVGSQRRRVVVTPLGLVALLVAGCAGQAAPTSAPAASVTTVASAVPATPEASEAPAASIAPAASAAPITPAPSPAASGEAVVRGAAGAIVGVIACFRNKSGQPATITIGRSNGGVGDNGQFALTDWGKTCMSRLRSGTSSANVYEFGATAKITSAGVGDFEMRAWADNVTPEVAQYGTMIGGRIVLSGFDAPYSQWRSVSVSGLTGTVSFSRGGDNASYATIDVDYGG